jgi:hypothetical protein
MDKELDALIAIHARNVELSAKAWTIMCRAQEASMKARDEEHKSADAIAEYLKKKIEPTLALLNTNFSPVSIDVDLGNDRGARNLRKLIGSGSKH